MLYTVKPKIRKFCMLSERNTGSNWVAALLKASFFQLLYLISFTQCGLCI